MIASTSAHATLSGPPKFEVLFNKMLLYDRISRDISDHAKRLEPEQEWNDVIIARLRSRHTSCAFRPELLAMYGAKFVPPPKPTRTIQWKVALSRWSRKLINPSQAHLAEPIVFVSNAAAIRVMQLKSMLRVLYFVGRSLATFTSLASCKSSGHPVCLLIRTAWRIFKNLLSRRRQILSCCSGGVCEVCDRNYNHGDIWRCRGQMFCNPTH